MNDAGASRESDTPRRKLERFEALTRGLLKVPKAEIDEAERKRKKRRPRTSAQ